MKESRGAPTLWRGPQNVYALPTLLVGGHLNDKKVLEELGAEREEVPQSLLFESGKGHLIVRRDLGVSAINTRADYERAERG